MGAKYANGKQNFKTQRFMKKNICTTLKDREMSTWIREEPTFIDNVELIKQDNWMWAERIGRRMHK